MTRKQHSNRTPVAADSLAGFAFHPDGRRLATFGMQSTTVRLIDTLSGTEPSRTQRANISAPPTIFVMVLLLIFSTFPSVFLVLALVVSILFLPLFFNFIFIIFVIFICFFLKAWSRLP